MFKQNSAILLVNLTRSNVFFTLTSLDGQILGSVSAGQFKTKGAKKVTVTTIKACLLKLNQSITQNLLFHVKFKGLSKHKRLILKLLTKNLNYAVLSFADITTLPHNGTKPTKIRRI